MSSFTRKKASALLILAVGAACCTNASPGSFASVEAPNEKGVWWERGAGEVEHEGLIKNLRIGLSEKELRVTKNWPPDRKPNVKNKKEDSGAESKSWWGSSRTSREKKVGQVNELKVDTEGRGLGREKIKGVPLNYSKERKALPKVKAQSTFRPKVVKDQKRSIVLLRVKTEKSELATLAPKRSSVSKDHRLDGETFRETKITLPSEGEVVSTKVQPERVPVLENRLNVLKNAQSKSKRTLKNIGARSQRKGSEEITNRTTFVYPSKESASGKSVKARSVSQWFEKVFQKGESKTKPRVGVRRLLRKGVDEIQGTVITMLDAELEEKTAATTKPFRLAGWTKSLKSKKVKSVKEQKASVVLPQVKAEKSELATLVPKISSVSKDHRLDEETFRETKITFPSEGEVASIKVQSEREPVSENRLNVLKSAQSKLKKNLKDKSARSQRKVPFLVKETNFFLPEDLAKNKPAHEVKSLLSLLKEMSLFRGRNEGGENPRRVDSFSLNSFKISMPQKVLEEAVSRRGLASVFLEKKDEPKKVSSKVAQISSGRKSQRKGFEEITNRTTFVYPAKESAIEKSLKPEPVSQWVGKIFQKGKPKTKPRVGARHLLRKGVGETQGTVITMLDAELEEKTAATTKPFKLAGWTKSLKSKKVKSVKEQKASVVLSQVKAKKPELATLVPKTSSVSKDHRLDEETFRETKITFPSEGEVASIKVQSERVPVSENRLNVLKSAQSKLKKNLKDKGARSQRKGSFLVKGTDFFLPEDLGKNKPPREVKSLSSLFKQMGLFRGRNEGGEDQTNPRRVDSFSLKPFKISMPQKVLEEAVSRRGLASVFLEKKDESKKVSPKVARIPSGRKTQRKGSEEITNRTTFVYPLKDSASEKSVKARSVSQWFEKVFQKGEPKPRIGVRRLLRKGVDEIQGTVITMLGTELEEKTAAAIKPFRFAGWLKSLKSKSVKEVKSVKEQKASVVLSQVKAKKPELATLVPKRSSVSKDHRLDEETFLETKISLPSEGKVAFIKVQPERAPVAENRLSALKSAQGKLKRGLENTDAGSLRKNLRQEGFSETTISYEEAKTEEVQFVQKGSQKKGEGVPTSSRFKKYFSKVAGLFYFKKKQSSDTPSEERVGRRRMPKVMGGSYVINRTEQVPSVAVTTQASVTEVADKKNKILKEVAPITKVVAKKVELPQGKKAVVFAGAAVLKKNDVAKVGQVRARSSKKRETEGFVETVLVLPSAEPESTRPPVLSEWFRKFMAKKEKIEVGNLNKKLSSPKNEVAKGVKATSKISKKKKVEKFVETVLKLPVAVAESVRPPLLSELLRKFKIRKGGLEVGGGKKRLSPSSSDALKLEAPPSPNDGTSEYLKLSLHQPVKMEFAKGSGADTNLSSLVFRADDPTRATSIKTQNRIESFITGVGEYLVSTVENIRGRVEINSPFKVIRRVYLGETLNAWDKIFTGRKSSCFIQLSKGIRIELGANSVIQMVGFDPGAKTFKVFLMSGRLRARVEGGLVTVKTPTAKVQVKEGHADVIITSFNTLVAPRSGGRIEIDSSEAKKYVKPGQYCLITYDGDMVISNVTSGENNKDKNLILRRGREELLPAESDHPANQFKNKVEEKNSKRRLLKLKN